MIKLHRRSCGIATGIARKHHRGRSCAGSHNEGSDLEAADKVADRYAMCVGEHIPHVPGKAKGTRGNLNNEQIEIRVLGQPRHLDMHVLDQCFQIVRNRDATLGGYARFRPNVGTIAKVKFSFCAKPEPQRAKQATAIVLSAAVSFKSRMIFLLYRGVC